MAEPPRRCIPKWFLFAKMALALLYANAILFVKQALFVLLRPLPGVPAAPVAIFVRPITLACTA